MDCCELFVAGECPETIEKIVFWHSLFRKIVQSFFIFELLIYPQVISIMDMIAQISAVQLK